MKALRFHVRVHVLAALLLVAAAVQSPAVGGDSAHGPTLVKERFGQMPDGTPVERYTLHSGQGLEAQVMTLGATLTTVRFPDRNGKSEAITLHKDSLEGYLAGHPLFGSVVGRFANRIAGARFVLDGVEYKLEANAGKNQIHGGGAKAAYHNLVWNAQPVLMSKGIGLRLWLTSPDGQGGFPGTLQVEMLYRVTTDNELVMEYKATTDRPTHLNLTNHAYWNLAGASGGDVLGHVVQLNAKRALVTDKDLIPSGEIRSVAGTPLDFTEPHTIGSRVGQVQRKFYDDCFVLEKKPGERLALAARVVEPKSGRVMEVLTTQPGVQLYTGDPHGLCLETQHFPDSPNHAAFPSTVLRPGETFHETTIHRFSVEKK
jgi:aldose 1-epimerase